MLSIIGKKFPVKVWKAGSPFETLVQTILSQNTTDNNSEAAMRKLRKRYKINPRTLAKARISELTPCIKQAGLYRSKAPRIKAVSRIIQDQYGGRLTPILNRPYGQAKNELITFLELGLRQPIYSSHS